MKPVKDMTDKKNKIYSERNKIVSLISKIFSSSLERHPEEDKDWEDDWRWIVYIQLPTGQVSWHIHDSEISLFDHLPRNIGIKWDGHSIEEKYRRVLAFDGLSDLVSYIKGLK